MIYIRVEPIPSKGVYRLLESVIIEGLLIPDGFESDGASVPNFLWPIIGSPFDPRFIGPAFYHDRGYYTGELPRDVLDWTFRKLLLGNGVAKELAESMYTGVYLFGKSHYNKKVVMAV